MRSASESAANLHELWQIRNLGKTRYKLATGHVLLLNGKPIEFSPVTPGDTRRIVLSSERDLILDVRDLVKHTGAEISPVDIYVNKKLNIGFIVPVELTGDNNKKSTPIKLLTRKEFDSVLATRVAPFIWPEESHRKTSSPDEQLNPFFSA